MSRHLSERPPGARGHGFHGLEHGLHSLTGAFAVRVVHAGGQTIEAHHHQWASLTLPVLGDYVERYDEGDVAFAGPSAMLHPPGAIHASQIGAGGMETVSIQFDPAWLRGFGFDRPLDRARHWQWGPVGAAARALARTWTAPARSEADLGHATAAFLAFALRTQTVPPPDWIARVANDLAAPQHATAVLAQERSVQPAWLARAYRAAAGEGLRDTLRRKRVERAVVLLRETEGALPDIAIAAGFCDQSHMNRCFKALIGRTPQQVRRERATLARR